MDRGQKVQSPITKFNKPYYNVQIQLGTNTYSTVFIPAGVNLGKRRIRNAFTQSMESGSAFIFSPPQRKGQPWPLQRDG